MLKIEISEDDKITISLAANPVRDLISRAVESSSILQDVQFQ